VFTGAGISVPSGIKDFRSKDGIYSEIKKYNVPYAEAIFDINYYIENPFPFY